MKTKKERALFWYPLIGSILLFTFLGCNKISSNTQTREINVAQQNDGGQDVTGEEVIWHVKAVHPDGKLLDVKALDDNGHVYDIKSIQYTDQISLMDVKAFVNDKIVPVKVLVSDEELLPVKAILEDGTVLDVKAILDDGTQLDVRGVSQSGNIVHINVINEIGEYYSVEAISPKGWINDIKGVKMFKNPVEVVVNGVEVYAHIKALAQTY